MTFDCKKDRTTFLREESDRFGEFDLFANGNFILDFVQNRYGDAFMNSSYPMKMFYYSDTKVGAAMHYTSMQYSIRKFVLTLARTFFPRTTQHAQLVPSDHRRYSRA